MLESSSKIRKSRICNLDPERDPDSTKILQNLELCGSRSQASPSESFKNLQIQTLLNLLCLSLTGDELSLACTLAYYVSSWVREREREREIESAPEPPAPEEGGQLAALEGKLRTTSLSS